MIGNSLERRERLIHLSLIVLVVVGIVVTIGVMSQDRIAAGGFSEPQGFGLLQAE